MHNLCLCLHNSERRKLVWPTLGEVELISGHYLLALESQYSLKDLSRLSPKTFLGFAIRNFTLEEQKILPESVCEITDLAKAQDGFEVFPSLGLRKRHLYYLPRGKFRFKMATFPLLFT